MSQQQKQPLTTIERDFTTPAADRLSLELSLQNLKSIRDSTRFKYESNVLGLFDQYEKRDSIYLCHLCGCSIDNKEVYNRLIEHQPSSEKKDQSEKEGKKKEKQQQRLKLQELVQGMQSHLESHLREIEQERKKLTTGSDNKPKRPPQIIFRVNSVIDNLEEQLNLLGGSKELLESVGVKRAQVCEHEIELHKKIVERAIYVNHDAVELIKRLHGFA